MEKGTEALAKVAEAVDYREPEAIELSDARRRRDPRDPGPDGRRSPSPTRPPPPSSACRVRALLEHLESMRERRALRRVAAILFHRRAGFSANGMGVWQVPEERILELAPRMASFRGISHCYQRPTYADWPYSVFTMAHGRSKEECDAILDSIAADTGIDERRDALLLDRVQEDPHALLHRRSRGVGSAVRADRALDGRLRSARWSCSRAGSTRPVRAMRAIGRDPIFVARGEGAELIDVDGNRYVDWVMSWGPLIAGHAHPESLPRSPPLPRRAPASARRPRPRCELAAEVVERVPSAEMVRMVSSGTEASMSALRLARAATGRDQIAQVRRRLPRPRRRPARRGGLGPGHAGHPRLAGRDRRAGGGHRGRSLGATVPDGRVRGDRSASPTRPTWAWCRRRTGFLAALRERADETGALLVFDEVISGFRVGRGRRPGARGRDPRPDASSAR